MLGQFAPGVVVLEGSEAALLSSKSLTGGVVGKRSAMIESNLLLPFGNKLRFARDHLFRSPSQAATVVVGYSINGREAWRLEDGISYAQYENRLVALIVNDVAPVG